MNLNCCNDTDSLESSILSADKTVHYLNSGNLFNVIFINNNKEENNLKDNNIDDEYDTQLISGLNLFPKIGTTYSEKTEPRRVGSSSKK